MNSDYDIYANKDLFAPVIFRSDFGSDSIVVVA